MQYYTNVMVSTKNQLQVNSLQCQQNLLYVLFLIMSWSNQEYINGKETLGSNSISGE